MNSKMSFGVHGVTLLVTTGRQAFRNKKKYGHFGKMYPLLPLPSEFLLLPVPLLYLMSGRV